MKNYEGNEYVSECWPLQSVWFDYMKQETRDYVKSLYCQVPNDCDDPENYIWTDKDVLIWNDMNEPACFN